MEKRPKLTDVQPPTLNNGKWFDWSKAAKINDRIVNDYIREAFEIVRKQIVAGHFPAYGYVASGDTVVLARCYAGEREIQIEILTPRLSQSVWFER